MKKFKAILLSLLLVVNVFAFSACGKDKNTNKDISAVSAGNLSSLYYVTDRPNLENVTIKLTYKDKTTKTLTKGEIDLPDGTKPQSTTEFVLYTGGLYAQTLADENLTAGTYDFKVFVVEDGKSHDLDDVVVSADASEIYNLTQYKKPENFAKFDTKSTEQGTEEENFKLHTDTVLTVGNANPFSIKPVFTLTGKDDPTNIVNQDTAFLLLDIEVKNSGTVVEDGTYSFENGKIKFSDDAVNNTYTITVVPHDFSDDPENTFTLTVKVESGYNIEHAYELGLLNMIDHATRKATDWESAYDQSLQVFYNSSSANKYEARNYYDVWRPYLEEMFDRDGLDKTLIKETNSVFILNDLTVGAEDVPEDYLISVEESAYAAGYSRDWSFLYQHFMTNNFSMNGNYFNISFEKFPVARTNQEYGGLADVYTGNNAHVEIGHSAAFTFIGKEDGTTTYRAAIKNLDTRGNANTDNTPEDDDQNALAKGLICLRTMYTGLDITNMIIKNYIIAYDVDYCKQTNESKFRYTKIYDSFSNAVYNYGAPNGGQFNFCEIKRCGGPAILLVGVDNNITTGMVVDNNSVIESYIVGDEPWFTIQTTESIPTLMAEIDSTVATATSSSPVGQKSIYKSVDGVNKANCICVAIDKEYMKTSNEQLHAKLTYFGNTFNTDTVLNTPNNGQHIAGILQYLELVQNMPGGGVGKLGIVVQIF